MFLLSTYPHFVAKLKYIMDIRIKNESEEVLVFIVEVDDMKYEITVDRDYWKKLTGGVFSPKELVQKSFEFFLKKEPQRDILKKFNLKVISEYFPEYEREVST